MSEKEEHSNSRFENGNWKINQLRFVVGLETYKARYGKTSGFTTSQEDIENFLE
jgi:hypothetical protein